MQAQKEIVEELKVQWKKLWQERFDDHEKAEGVAITDYMMLYVEQGTIIHATRDFKALNFKEILEQHKVENADRFIPPSPQIGGWKKFIKTSIATQKPSRRRLAMSPEVKKDPRRCLKKGGRGWLHY